MKPYYLLLLLISFSLNSAFGEEENNRFNIPFVPDANCKILADREVIGTTEKIFKTLWAPKDIWNSLSEVDLRKESSFSFTYDDAVKRAFEFHGDNPPSVDPAPKKLIRRDDFSVERVTVIETQENLKNNIGRYYYCVHFIGVYDSPDGSHTEQMWNQDILVLPNGWAGYPHVQFMKIHKKS
ncbi:MAG: hypothetical protein WCP72_11705 [Desulfomonile sp.]